MCIYSQKEIKNCSDIEKIQAHSNFYLVFYIILQFYSLKKHTQLNIRHDKFLLLNRLCNAVGCRPRSCYLS